MNISFVSMLHISHCQICLLRGVSVADNEIFVHIDTHLSNRWICASAMASITQLTDFIPAMT